MICSSFPENKRMEYPYQGKSIDRLLQSYESDKKPFLTDTAIKFPSRYYEFEEINILKKLFFPNYWNCGSITKRKNRNELKKIIDELGILFFKGVQPYFREENNLSQIIHNVSDKLPDVREKLKKDVKATYEGDPAARSYTEIIRAYPGFTAIEVHRVANLLYKFGANEYARELAEHIHSKTGIDIHPGAQIGEYFFIDHESGVVIGETTKIGSWVRIYQDVTLGVLHFEKDNDSTLRKGYKRHPNIGDHVVIGAGSKILGPINIGNHVNIGANSWITEDIPDYTSVFIAEHPRLERRPKRNKIES